MLKFEKKKIRRQKVNDKLDAANRYSSSKSGKVDNRLHILEIRTVVLPSAESQNNSTEVSAPTGLSSTIMATHGSRQSVGRPECQCDRSHVDEADVLLSLRNTSNVSND